ncbi:MAG: hypothetical protein GWO38_31350, partial [Phycisphaerae bacterium]|nr:hypothetical protein [Phycisphaerae bacterium]NIX32000.1 hypothetical protein [Phycisphaerae bacterium]
VAEQGGEAALNLTGSPELAAFAESGVLLSPAVLGGRTVGKPNPVKVASDMSKVKKEGKSIGVDIDADLPTQRTQLTKKAD